MKTVQYYHFIFPTNGTYRIKVEDFNALIGDIFPNLIEQPVGKLAELLPTTLSWNAIRASFERISPPKHISEEQEWNEGLTGIITVERPEYLYKYEDVD